MTTTGISSADDFNFAKDAPVTLFGEAGQRILASTEPELVLHLNAHRRLSPRRTTAPLDIRQLSRWPSGWALRGRPYQSMRYDALYVADLSGSEPAPVVERGLEILHSLVAQKLSVGVVNLSPGLIEKSSDLVKARDNSQISLLDPRAGLGNYRMAALANDARRRAFSAHLRLEEHLDQDLALADRTLEPGRAVETRMRLWERFRDNVRTDVIVVRDPMTEFGSVAPWEERGQARIVSFQHGVVSGFHTYLPVLGTTHLTYGPESAQLIKRLNQRLNETLAPRHAGVVAIGNFIHGDRKGMQGEGPRNLLILDQSNRWSDSYYAFQSELDALVRIARTAIDSSSAVRVTIRPHPSCTDLGRWRALVDSNGDRVSFSHPATPLSHDVGNSSVAVSLFSGAALASALDNVPTVLISRDGRPWTPDLAAFASVTRSADEAVETVQLVMTDTETRAAWADRSREAADRYFGGAEYRPLSAELLSQHI